MIDLNTARYGALLLRVTSGSFLIAHAGLKILTFTPAGTAQFFESIGLPGPLAYLVIFAELFGGLALIAGFQTRRVALGLIPVLLGATWAHAGNGFFFNNANGGYEYPLFWAVTLGVQALLGAGAYALRLPAIGGSQARVTA